MKNKHGFTLIELLAVIVVLAIIALIATPIVMNAINKSKKGAAERSAENYIKQVEVAIATKRLDESTGDLSFLDGTYTINSDGNLEGNNLTEPLVIEVSGDKPTSGTIIVKDGEVQANSTMTIGDYSITYSDGKCSATKNNSDSEQKEEDTSSEDETSTVVYESYGPSKNIGDTLDPTQYTSSVDAILYSKYVLDKDNKVIELYACGVVDSDEYCVRGGDPSFYGWSEDEADYTGNVLVLKKLRDSGGNCPIYEDYSYCQITAAYFLYAYSSGRVEVNWGGGSK